MSTTEQSGQGAGAGGGGVWWWFGSTVSAGKWDGGEDEGPSGHRVSTGCCEFSLVSVCACLRLWLT